MHKDIKKHHKKMFFGFFLAELPNNYVFPSANSPRAKKSDTKNKHTAAAMHTTHESIHSPKSMKKTTPHTLYIII